jgi:hypothetical protein
LDCETGPLAAENAHLQVLQYASLMTVLLLDALDLAEAGKPAVMGCMRRPEPSEWAHTCSCRMSACAVDDLAGLMVAP